MQREQTCDNIEEITNLSQLDSLNELIDNLRTLKEYRMLYDNLTLRYRLINENFQWEYKQWFKPKKYTYIPNYSDFEEDEPNESEGEYYTFWMYYKNKYPQHFNLSYLYK